MKEPKVERDVAKDDLDRYFEENALEFDVEKMDAEDRADFEKIFERLINRIMDGSLVVTETGDAEFTTSEGDVVKFREPKGSALAASDSKKRGQDVGKTMAIMAAMTGKNAKFFSGLRMRDLRVCQYITQLFLD